MSGLHLTISQQPGGSQTLLAGIGRIARFAPFERIDGHFAFATAAGVSDLTLVLEEAARHNETAITRRRWLISLDFGHTEPDALRQLLKLAGSEVRVMDSAYLLRRHLQPRVVFHPKTLVLTAGRGLPIGASVGSGNLTRSGLRIGREHAVLTAVAEPILSHAERLDGTRLRAHLRLMGQDWRDADVLTDRLLTRYEAIRATRPRPPQNVAGRRPSDSRGRPMDCQPISWSRFDATRAFGSKPGTCMRIAGAVIREINLTCAAERAPSLDSRQPRAQQQSHRAGWTAIPRTAAPAQPPFRGQQHGQARSTGADAGR